jgi:uncharacterized membrane protein
MAAKGEQQSLPLPSPPKPTKKKKHTRNCTRIIIVHFSALIALCIVYLPIFSLVFLFVLSIYTCTPSVFTFILCFAEEIYFGRVYCGVLINSESDEDESIWTK